MYSVKHRILDQAGGVTEVVTNNLPKAAAEHLLVEVAKQYQYRGGEVVPASAKKQAVKK